ncbi:PAS domain-containing protein [Kamptonema animale CS-326]|jgi:two-component system CheB/CheR fusion protein|uniref:CheR family methyltransferase n=1 Tax=Kamptonema animale TaxID=92934 RepID=UPI00232E0024|nr:CheR family methyltransferase [Kamptonema animale]MDB9515258.1 PAS domain-containing protein [Kamptonema animale CS-326]
MSSDDQSSAFEALLNYLKRDRGLDFTGYKRPSLMRLMKKRMAKVGVESFHDYLDYVEVNPLELSQLFDALLLNVTTFFRDPPAWEILSEEIIPRILSVKPGKEPIRIWSAGCASGEEAYTLAIVLAEALGLEAFRSRVKIYATDLDEAALIKGRLATYSARELQNVPDTLRNKYFEATGINYTFATELRRSVIFGRHDLILNAPISRLDLLACRNTLMYFNSDTQRRILARFHFALNDIGFLFVGKAEMLLTHANLFTPENLKYRIFSKFPNINLRHRLLVMSDSDTIEDNSLRAGIVRLRDEAFESQPIAQMIVDIHGNLTRANRLARMLFEIKVEDVGRPLQDLEVSYRPAELRSPLQQAYAERTPVKISSVELAKPNLPPKYFDIEVTPLLDINRDTFGACIDFIEVTRYKQLQRELERYTQELETASEELQSTNEELETTNEELQSTNEELETTNEELQSTNEELETMNEEIQSSNEELQATNDELRQRTEELNRVNAFMHSSLSSLRVAMVVLTNKLSVQIWNEIAEEMWGLRIEEVQGHFFFDLDIGLPMEQLRQPIRACQTGTNKSQEIIVEAVNRRGRTIHCRIICTPIILGKEAQVIILLIEEKPAC